MILPAFKSLRQGEQLHPALLDSRFHGNDEKCQHSLVVFVLVYIFSISDMRGQEETFEPRVHTIDRILTIGDITVELSEIRESADTLELSHSDYTDLPYDAFMRLDGIGVWKQGREIGRLHSEPNLPNLRSAPSSGTRSRWIPMRAWT